MTNDNGNALPPDMLLVRERRRRLKGDANVVGPARPAPTEPVELVPPDEDRLLPIDAPPLEEPANGSLLIKRAVSHVDLAAFGHKKTIDHAALQSALMGSLTAAVCKALDIDSVAPELRVPSYDERANEPALAARLGRDDLAALRSALATAPKRTGIALLRAAALPDDVVGAPAFVAGIARSSLLAYRQAALATAWHEALGVTAPDDLARERDASAVNLLGTLRELLGIR